LASDATLFDVFLSHHHADAGDVEELGRALRKKFEFKVWLDRWELVPGQSWQRAIAKGLREAQTCAVCVGDRAAHGWFRNEVERALDIQACNDRYRVIPVLLPSAGPGNPERLLPDFVRIRTWVDFRAGLF
jgi:hypothetical protein